jgi:hypothetical protein
VVFAHLSLQPIYTGGVGGDDGILVAHHASGEEAEENSLDHKEYDRHGPIGAATIRPEAGVKSQENKPEGVHAQRSDIKAEEEEKLVVAEANTIIDPRAVVVHLYDAAVTDTAKGGKQSEQTRLLWQKYNSPAVVCPYRLERLAMAASFIFFAPVNIHWDRLQWDGSRIRHHRSAVTCQRHERDECVNDDVQDAENALRKPRHEDIGLQEQAR